MIFETGPHVDSIKFSGGIVAGLSLLSTRLMRLAPDRTDDNILNSSAAVDSDSERIPFYYLNCSKEKADNTKTQLLYRHDAFTDDNNLFEGTIEMKLNRRSLYILSGPLRYSFSHEIFGAQSKPQLFNDDITAERRLSVIFRDALP